MMKKRYVTPRVKAMELKLEDRFLELSNVNDSRGAGSGGGDAMIGEDLGLGEDDSSWKIKR